MKTTQKVTCCFVLFSAAMGAQQTSTSLAQAATQTGKSKAPAAHKNTAKSAHRLLASIATDAALVRPAALTGNAASGTAAAAPAAASAVGNDGAPDPVFLTKKAGSVAPMISTAASVQVKAKDRPDLEPEATSTRTFSGEDVLKSAGTFQDLPRFLQTLPGVVGGSDVQNAAVVRGGNSVENLYVIDKIEVPNINHIALAGSTGGLGSMLDTNNIASVNFSSAAFSSTLQSHLSSVTDIRTIELPKQSTYSVDAGYSGAGFRVSRSLGLDKTLLISGRESVTNLLTDNIGLNGSPEFTNSFAKYAWDASSRDHFWVDTLFGRDRLKIVPRFNDNWETFAFDTTYTGWRDTTGMVWQHTYKNNSVGTWSLSNSQQQQDLSQLDQINADQLLFRQNNNDGSSTMRYEHLTVADSGSSTSMGFDMRQNRISYDVAQPSGVFSSYNTSTVAQDAFAATPQFHTLDKAAFFESTIKVRKRLLFTSGVRLQQFGFHPGLVPVPASTTPATTAPPVGSTTDNAVASNSPCCIQTKSTITGYQAYMPHATLSLLASKRVNFKASFGKYADLPPYAYLATLPSNANLGLIHSQQIVLGAAIRIGSLLDVNVEAYRKLYKGYPVAANLPTVSLANTLPTINEPFNVMALTSLGRGKVQGVEVSIKQAPWHHIVTDTNLSFSRALYTGSDGIYRPGNFDFPFVWNTMAGAQIKKINLMLRNSMSSGRPYTGILAEQSLAQNRLIYDLATVNAFRGPMYQRLDMAVNRDVMVHGRAMNLHVGLINLLVRKNFYTEAWRPRCAECGVIDEHQAGMVPDFGASYTF